MTKKVIVIKLYVKNASTCIMYADARQRRCFILYSVTVFLYKVLCPAAKIDPYFFATQIVISVIRIVSYISERYVLYIYLTCV